MQTEAKKFYDQLFRGGIIELQKTVSVRVAATDMCGRQLDAWTSSKSYPIYDLPKLTNKQINEMNLDEVEEAVYAH